MLSKNMEDKTRTIFDFSLCAVSLPAVLVTYFGSGLGELSGLES